MPSSKFKLGSLREINCPTSLVVANHEVPDVPKAFRAIGTSGDPLAAGDGGVFPPFRYTQVQSPGINEAMNHFQGVQRLRTEPYLVVSGGNKTRQKQAHVFVIHMGSRQGPGPWGSNLLHQPKPNPVDSVIKAYCLDTVRWHAGGLSVCGNVLAVPLEGGKKSRVAFLHVKNPERVTRFKCQIDRPKLDKAGAAALTTMSDGRFLCAVWRRVKKKPAGRLDFYISKSTDFCDGFEENNPVTWAFKGFLNGDDRDPAYQNINFVMERAGADGSQRLFMIGTENGAGTAPFGNGPNLADLWELEISSEMFERTPNRPKPRLRLEDTVKFFGLSDYCNFDAQTGIHVASSGQLYVYAGYHWRFNQELRFTEFRSVPETVPDIGSAWIELFEHENYQGRRIGLYGPADAIIGDYEELFVQGGSFDNRVLSARYRIPEGSAYRLYREVNHSPDTQAGVDYVDLVGDGTLQQVRNLSQPPYSFGHKVSSSKYVQTT